MKKLSLIIPIYNEAGHLRLFLQKIDDLKLPCQKELIFIDDCSKDDSLKILRDFSFQSPFIILENSVNKGKGSSLQRGIKEATGDFIGIQDADFEYDMQDIPRLIQPLLDERADIVFGSRFKKENQQVHRTFHYLINRILTLLSNILCGLYLSDMETCYKFFRADIIKNIRLESKRFGFEPEITAKVARLKVRTLELPISYFPRNYLEGKKITWKDGIAALWHLLYFNWGLKPEKVFFPELPQHYIFKGNNWL